jgi:hypothetical protein
MAVSDQEPRSAWVAAIDSLQDGRRHARREHDAGPVPTED